MKFDPNKLVRLNRPNYFDGRVLTPADLRAEQDYQREKQWLHNRMLHGYGVVSGLEVLIEETVGAAEIIVSPGYALDGWGREIVVPEPVRLRLPRERRDVLVSVKYVEQDNDPDSDRGMISRTNAPSILESAQVLLEPPPAERAMTPATRPDFAIAIARLRRPHLTWQRDRAFRASRTR